MAIGGCSSQPSAGRTSRSSPAEPVVLSYRDPVSRSQLRERALEVLMAASTSEWAQERANAIEGLLEAPSRVEAVAAAGLKDENEGVRSVSAMVVGRAGLSALAPAVRPLLRDPSPYVRASAIFALARLGEQVDQGPLAEILFNHSSARVRAHAAYVIGQIGNDSALPMLGDAARRRTPGASEIEQKLLQLQIAEAMVRLGDRSQLDAIRAALHPARPEDLEATALAAQIIGSLGDRDSIDRLIYLSAYRGQQGTQPPAEVMLAVAGALSELGVGGGTAFADEYASSPNEALRAQAAYLYGQVGKEENLDKLARLMEDPGGLTRISAATATLRILGRSSQALGR